jgi:hypothetical protein
MVADTAFPRGWERFQWKQLADGNYELFAFANNKLVETRANGNLLNTGTQSTFKLIPVSPDPQLNLPAQGKLKNVKTGQYVSSSQANPVLGQTTDKLLAATFKFEKVAGMDADTIYGIRNAATGKAITADPRNSGIPLSSARDLVNYWEQFRILQPAEKGGAYVIVYVPTGLAMASQSDGKVRNTDAAVGDESVWVIEQ